MVKTYKEALDYIFDFEKIKDYSLEKVKLGVHKLGNPQSSYKIIHIAGTNGKGSTCNMCFGVVKNWGKKVGIFTSPHLIDIRERFKTQTGLISEEDFLRITNKILDLNIDFSYFEKCVLIALEYFREKKCEYVILETGVGGLLDSTNVITPVVTCITSVGYDHMEMLGETLEDIAFQKAGIIKPTIPIVLNFNNETIEKIANKKNSPIIFTDKLVPTNLIGHHQQKNSSLAYEICKYLGVPEDIIKIGLKSISYRGRLEYLEKNLLIDGAHNIDGLNILKAYLSKIENKFKNIVYCFSIKQGKQKKIKSLIIEIFGKDKKYIIVKHQHFQLAQPKEIQKQLNGIKNEIKTPEEIKLLANLNKDTLYLVFGSLYMIGGFYNKTDLN